jgi:hypothetical protein
MGRRAVVALCVVAGLVSASCSGSGSGGGVASGDASPDEAAASVATTEAPVTTAFEDTTESREPTTSTESVDSTDPDGPRATVPSAGPSVPIPHPDVDPWTHVVAYEREAKLLRVFDAAGAEIAVVESVDPSAYAESFVTSAPGRLVAGSLTTNSELLVLDVVAGVEYVVPIPITKDSDLITDRMARSGHVIVSARPPSVTDERSDSRAFAVDVATLAVSDLGQHVDFADGDWVPFFQTVNSGRALVQVWGSDYAAYLFDSWNAEPRLTIPDGSADLLETSDGLLILSREILGRGPETELRVLSEKGEVVYSEQLPAPWNMAFASPTSLLFNDGRIVAAVEFGSPSITQVADGEDVELLGWNADRRVLGVRRGQDLLLLNEDFELVGTYPERSGWSNWSPYDRSCLILTSAFEDAWTLVHPDGTPLFVGQLPPRCIRRTAALSSPAGLRGEVRSWSAAQ